MGCVSWVDYEGDIPEKVDSESSLVEWSISLATFSDWFRNELLGVLRGETPTIPSSLYIAAHSTTCTAQSAGTELSGDGYTRTAVTFERVSDIKIWNPSDVISSLATAQWSIASLSIWDSATIGEGNYYAFGNLTTAITIAVNKSLTIEANKAVIGLGATVV